MKQLGLAVVGAIMLVAGSLFGITADGSRAPTAHGQATNAFMVTPTTCLAIMIGATDTAFAASHCGIIGGAAGFNLFDIELEIGDGDGVLEPDDFRAFSALEGKQIQQTDGFAFIVSFVNDTAPVSFDLDAGGGSITDTQVANFGPVPAQDFICAGPTSDQDCGGSAGGTLDGVVVVGLCGGVTPASNSLNVSGCGGKPTATRGEYALTVVQEQVPIDIFYTVVGVPNKIEIEAFEETVSTGVVIPAGCPLAADVAGFTAALGRPEKTVVIARVSDVDENDITGAWVDWKSVDPLIGTFATALTPTLNLGGFGFGAPNVFCGHRNPGVTKTTLTILRGPNSAAIWNPTAFLDDDTLDMTVIGPPSSMTLTATPPEINCDGTSTAQVSAQVTNAAGDPVVNGTSVRFDVQALGISNPISTGTAAGVASSTISPLSAITRGVTVVVSTGVGEPVDYDVVQSIIVACSGAAGAAPPPAGGGAGAPPPPGTGTISPPDTGLTDENDWRQPRADPALCGPVIDARRDRPGWGRLAGSRRRA